MSGQHASFSPSSAHRVVTCPASYRASLGLPDSANWAAVEGTIAHYIHEQCLAHGASPEQFVGMHASEFVPREEMHESEWAVVPQDYSWTQKDAEKLQESIDRCLEVEGYRLVEQRVSISNYTPISGQFGTSDHIAIDSRGKAVLYVDDLKWGVGVKVYAERNHQAALYALGVIDELECLFDFDEVVVRIMQPRLDHFDVWRTSVCELREMGVQIKERFTLALQPDAPYNPDEKACQFCKAKATCPALSQRAQEVALGMFDDLDAEITAPAMRDWPISAPDHDAMTPEQMASVLANRNLVIGFFDALEKRAVHMLMHGQQVPGYKLVEGRSVRVVKDAQGYETYLRENGVEPYRPRELIGLTDAEKGLKTKAKKAGLAAFVEKPRGKPTLATEGDKREAYTATSDDMFDVVSASDET